MLLLIMPSSGDGAIYVLYIKYYILDVKHHSVVSSDVTGLNVVDAYHSINCKGAFLKSYQVYVVQKHSFQTLKYFLGGKRV